MTTHRYTSLPTDTYYRGYRLSTFCDGDTAIYHQAEHIDTCGDIGVAKALIDEWLNAK